MLRSKIQFVNGSPVVNIDGKNYPPMAYTTYFDECGQWFDFIKSGYRMFFVNVSFTDLPINNFTGFTPFLTGVFENEIPDYSAFDAIVNGILSECPDAFIFPRVNIAMPRKWIAQHPYETVETPTGARESMYSDLFREDGAALLEILVSHIRNSSYADNIAGYQLCGGITQEWMHHDLFGSYSEMGNEKFRQWAKEKYGLDNIKAPLKEDFDNRHTEEIRLYYEFCNEKNAETVEFFASRLKKLVNNEQLVGVFYGYNGFVNAPLYGLHSLGSIIDSPYIDFFSSPCCYDGSRELGLDWGDMLPVDSVKLHGKLYFVECDIRTHLTKRMQDSRPGKYPEDIYTLYDDRGNKTVWCGPDNIELSLSCIKKAFLHQLSKASGIWWFDMWGGWYHDEKIMSELGRMYRIYEDGMCKYYDVLPSAEVVLFIDEKAYSNIKRGSHLMNTVNNIRVAMGNTGIPFDTYMVEDAPKVIKNYRAAIFTAPYPSEAGKNALRLCKELDILCIESDEIMHSYSTEELREILSFAGVHCYNHDSCVIYRSKNIIGIHKTTEEETKIYLPGKYRIRPLFSETAEAEETDVISIDIPLYMTTAYEISPCAK